MAKKEQPARHARPRASLLTKLVVVVLLAAIGWQLYELRGQVEIAQAEKERYTQQVESQQQQNNALAADIAEGATPEKMEEIAREKLGYGAPGEYVFYDTSN